MTDTEGSASPELSVELFQAAKAGDLGAVNEYIAAGADVAYQDHEGVSPLMTAAEEGHAEVVAALLQAGAPWNQQDTSGYCAGEYATASKNQAIVEMLMEWGVQAELLLGARDRSSKDVSTSSQAANAGYLQQKLVYTDDGTKLLDADGEAVMMGWEAPLMERHAAAICGQGGGHYLNVGFGLGIIDTEIQKYNLVNHTMIGIHSDVYAHLCGSDRDRKGVNPAPIDCAATAAAAAATFCLQKYNPVSHTIIEAHPDVHAHMLKQGWDKKPGVKILFGRWQDVAGQLEQYDGIFFGEACVRPC